jgi:hypothetical protein
MTSNTREELAVLQHIRSSKQIDMNYLHNQFKKGIISPVARSKTIKLLHTTFMDSQQRGKNIEYDKSTDTFKLTSKIKTDTSSYSKKVERETSIPWRVKGGFVSGVPTLHDGEINTDPRTTCMAQVNPLYGLEFEMQAKGSSHVTNDMSSAYNHVRMLFGGEDYCDIKSDSSTGDYGFELVTIPKTFKELKATVARAFQDKYLLSKVKVTERHGIHIHVSSMALWYDQMMYMMYFMHDPKREAFLYKLGGRRGNHGYAMNSQDWFVDKSITNLSTFRSKYVEFLDRISLDRRVLSPSRQHETLEFRGFNATLDVNVLISYIEFVDAVVCFTASASGGVRTASNDITTTDFILWLLNRKMVSGHTNLEPRKEYITLVRRIVLEFYPTAFTITGNTVSVDVPKLTELTKLM